jgi:hypothetical protein
MSPITTTNASDITPVKTNQGIASLEFAALSDALMIAETPPAQSRNTQRRMMRSIVQTPDLSENNEIEATTWCPAADKQFAEDPL